MKRFLKFLCLATVVITLAFGIYEFSNKYNLNLIYSNIEWSINIKDCIDAVSFDFDNEGNIYIAYKDYIKVIKDNKEEVLLKQDSFNIYDIACYKGDIIIATGNDILRYYKDDKKLIQLVENMPNKGLNKETKIIINNDDLYITIGSNTNSGVVEQKGGEVDKASFEWISTGVSYGNTKTSAFSEFGKIINEGEKIKEEALSNASILKYNLISNEIITYSTGLRNIEGLDFDSSGKMIAIVGGMEDSGVRPVKDDFDYIYEIKEKAWYGWPDFSGGDPIISPRFADEDSKLSFVIANHPTEVTLGPMYQHTSVSSLRGLAIDDDGNFLVKDTVIFADSKKNIVYAKDKDGYVREIIALNDNCNIKKIKYYKSSIYILDNNIGCVYKVEVANNNTGFNIPKFMLIFLINFLIIILICLLYKYKRSKK
ncbi:hypothetical protein [Clostridium celatum]|uniref:hypothetical protein n=1 Tax=Clostridium celatum TaxID=36834 RepID=UPI001F2A42A9|nr:hypothetical protein [Clostridium celatum]MCE9654235.1 hypothetical protein [Clostridium celatum]MDU6294724.1 hypothetical protein [Clostridium celatum]MDY3361816.1 hypothetical protein [Clostridium celatum]